MLKWFEDFINKWVETSFTPNDWEFGFGFSFPAKSEKFFLGTKLTHKFRVYLFLGPITILVGLQPEIEYGESNELVLSNSNRDIAIFEISNISPVYKNHK